MNPRRLDPYPYRVNGLTFDGGTYSPGEIWVSVELNSHYPGIGVFDPRPEYEQDRAKYPA